MATSASMTPALRWTSRSRCFASPSDGPRDARELGVRPGVVLRLEHPRPRPSGDPRGRGHRALGRPSRSGHASLRSPDGGSGSAADARAGRGRHVARARHGEARGLRLQHRPGRGRDLRRGRAAEQRHGDDADGGLGSRDSQPSSAVPGAPIEAAIPTSPSASMSRSPRTSQRRARRTPDAGCTLEAEVLSVDGEVELAEAGLQVRAIDKETGRVVSSIGETDEIGDFAIRIGEARPSYLIRVTSSAGSEPFPAVSVDPDVAFADDPVENDLHSPTRSRSVHWPGSRHGRQPGAWRDGAVPVDGIFGGTSSGSRARSAAPLPRMRTAASASSFCPASIRSRSPRPRTLTTPGVSSPRNRWSAKRSTETATLIVPSQFGLRGWVTTFREESAPGVTILARARHDRGLGACTGRKRRSTELGAFAMSVDRGLYDMHVKTSLGNRFRVVGRAGAAMSEDGDLARGYRLDPPIPVRGVIRRRATERSSRRADPRLRVHSRRRRREPVPAGRRNGVGRRRQLPAAHCSASRRRMSIQPIAARPSQPGQSPKRV